AHQKFSAILSVVNYFARMADNSSFRTFQPTPY
ncbi:MAG: hypothetical protein ACI9CB_002359, partial [Rhodothermales bacterium]